MKGILFTIGGFIFSIFIHWYGGVDFIGRSVLNAWALCACVVVAGLIYFYLGWDNDDN